MGGVKGHYTEGAGLIDKNTAVIIIPRESMKGATSNGMGTLLF